MRVLKLKIFIEFQNKNFSKSRFIRPKLRVGVFSKLKIFYFSTQFQVEVK